MAWSAGNLLLPDTCRHGPRRQVGRTGPRADGLSTSNKAMEAWAKHGQKGKTGREDPCLLDSCRRGCPVTAHGFRSTFRDWAGETTAYPREVIEHALAHQLKDKAEAAYARGTLFDKRRNLMADWALFCDAKA